MPQINIHAEDIVAYARIEPRAIAADYKPTVKAQVHDALWMLTQQWRVGEFRGEDAGTLVKARVETQTTKLNRFKSRNGSVEAFDENVPLEAKVERLPLRMDLGFRLELGNIWFKLMAQSYPLDTEQLFKDFRRRFPIDPLTHASGPEKNSNKPAVRVRKLVTSRSMDGYKFYQYLVGGSDAGDVPTSGSFPLLNTIQLKFKVWLERTYYFPKTASENSWSDRQLEYQCSVSAPVNASPTAPQNVLLADKYTRGTIDWYSFDLSNVPNAKLNENAGVTISNAAAVLPSAAFSYIPHTIEFKGMPKGRWWEFEDKNNDLSKMLTQKQDITKMVIMEFGLIYSNDWFLIPHVVPDSSLNKVIGLVSTDVFGRNMLIRRSGSGMDEQWERWDMYNISKRGTENVETFAQLMMVPSVKNRMESDSLERVLFLRDEMANMVWGVEEVVPDELLNGMDGKHANNELQQYLADTTPPLPVADYIANPALHRFRISNEVPENWIPFIAKQVANPLLFGGRDVLLQRAAMLRYINGDYTNEIIRPRTDILSVGVATGDSYFIHEEEVSRAGFIISENFQRTRWYDGSTFTWLGRKIQSGKGEGNSGLKFDILQDKEADPGALDIPFSGMAGWWQANNPDNQVSAGRVTLLKDITGNQLDLGLWGSVAGPQLTTYQGQAALSFNSNLLLNQSTSKPFQGYDDFTIFYVGNSAIGRGFDNVGGGMWSMALRPDTMNVVLANAGQTQYTINTGLGSGIRIIASTLEQRDPALPPHFAARISLYSQSGDLLSTPNNPYVVPNNNFLRATSSIGLTMGATASSGAYADGYTFETIIYRRKLSLAEIKRVMAYLSARYPFAG